MTNPITHDAFKITTDSKSLTMKLYLHKNGFDLGPVEISTKEASQIAALALGNARDAYDRTGRPLPNRSARDKVDLTVISPSELGIGPGRKSDKTILMLHFGDTTLGVEFPNAELRKFAQQLLTTVADEGAPQ